MTTPNAQVVAATEALTMPRARNTLVRIQQSGAGPLEMARQLNGLGYLVRVRSQGEDYTAFQMDQFRDEIEPLFQQTVSAARDAGVEMPTRWDGVEDAAFLIETNELAAKTLSGAVHSGFERDEPAF